jgi:hypothetical protein
MYFRITTYDYNTNNNNFESVTNVSVSSFHKVLP